jgi:archaellum biogenesis protein FlaJ (TadC family)
LRQEMNRTPIAKFMLLFTACFISVLLFATYAVVSGLLSPREFGIALTSVCAIGFVVLWVAFVKLRTKEAAAQISDAPPVVLDVATRKRLTRSIRIHKAIIAFFVLCLAGALAESRGAPLVPVMVGVTMNLLWTAGLVLRVRQLQRTLAEGQAVTSDQSPTRG